MTLEWLQKLRFIVAGIQYEPECGIRHGQLIDKALAMIDAEIMEETPLPGRYANADELIAAINAQEPPA